MIETKFKHTDIGLVPEDWEVKTLGQIGSFTKGSGISRAESQTGTIPAIRYGEIYTDHNDYIREFKSYITPQIALNARKIHKGDILFTASGETKEDIGKSVAFIDDFEAYAGGDLIILSPSEDCNPVYMGYITNSKSSQLQKSSKGQGDAVVHIVTDEIKSIEIPFPPLSEQRRIASALMKIDALISNLDKLIQKKHAIKKGAMQELLTGKKRLPGFKGEWKEIRLGDVCSLFGRIGFRGYTKSDLVEKGHGAISFSPSDIHNSKIDLNNCDYISFAKYEESPEIKVYNGDILFCKTASIGKCAMVENLNEKATINPQFVVLKDFKCDNHFLYYTLIDTPFQTNVLSITGGSTIPTMSQEKLKQQILFFPPTISEQCAISKVLSIMDSDISILEKKRNKYQQITLGMMRELLTGRIRLVEDDHMERKCYSIGLQNQSFDGAVAAEPSPQ